MQCVCVHVVLFLCVCTHVGVCVCECVHAYECACLCVRVCMALPGSARFCITAGLAAPRQNGVRTHAMAHLAFGQSTHRS